MTQKEFTDLVYDTLMKNTQHPQLDLSKVTDQWCVSEAGAISITYENEERFSILILKD